MNFKLKLNRFGKGIKAHSPEILLVSGLIEGAVGTVFACKAAIKIHDANTLDKMENVMYRSEDGTLVADFTPDKKKATVDKTIDICKAFAPAAGLMLASATSIVASHGIMRKRYAGLVVAYGTLTSSFMEYRARVREEVGEKREEELYYGTEKQSVPVKTTGKDGKEKTVSKKLDVRTREGLSPYASMFNAMYALDTEDPYYIDSHLVTVENQMNDLLKAEGHVYLNDIRKRLFMDTDDAGQLVGWMYDPQRFKDGNGDNQIRITKKIIRVPKPEGGFDPEIWLDFNVDGVIFGKMSKEEYNTHIQEVGDQGIEFSNKED